MKRRGQRRLARLTAVAVAAGALVVATAAVAEAHALVRSSVPANGSEVAKAPRVVLLTFTQPPDPKLSFLHVLDSTGKQVDAGPSRAVPGEPLELEVPLPPTLGNGTYTITWRAVSRVDGHVTGGFLTFGVGVAPSSGGGTTAVAPTTPPPPPLGVIGRWLFYWGLAALLGSASFGTIVRRGLPERARALLAVAWLACGAGVIAMTLAERSVIGVSLSGLLTSNTGREFIERAAATAVTGVAVIWFILRPGRRSLGAVGLTSAGAMLVHALAGHAAESKPSWFNVGVQWLHLVAVAVWIGGLVWLIGTFASVPVEARARTTRRYSTMAGFALAGVALTGLSRLLDEVGWPQHWARLVDTSYGITVLIKVGLFVPLVALGATNRYRNVPAVEAGRGFRSLARTATAELGIAALIFAATGVLTELPPAATVAAAAARPAAAQQLILTGHDFATTTKVRLTVAPGNVGQNRFVARITDFDTGRPAPATSVTLTFSLPSQPSLGQQTLALQRQGTDWVGRGTTLSMFGTWSVQVTVQEATTGTSVPLRLTPNLPAEQVVAPSPPAGQPTLFTISLAGGRSLQTYIQPGRPGRDTVHFTFFMANGNELPISSATALSVPPGGEVQPMPLIRFDKGHFVANTTLRAGRWRFIIQATPATGGPVTAYFDQTIG